MVAELEFAVIGTTPPTSTRAVEHRQWRRFQRFDDVRSATRVALIGKTVAENLFGDDDPVGKTMRIQQNPFIVIGVLGSKGQNLDGRDQDDTVIIPLSTAQRKVFGARPSSVRCVRSWCRPIRRGHAAVDGSVTALLRQRHRLREGMPGRLLHAQPFGGRRTRKPKRRAPCPSCSAPSPRFRCSSAASAS